MRISIIAAVAENGVIGRDGRLPWHLSDDLRRFKQLTMRHTIVMGRRTWESVGRPLAGRRMIVVSRRADYQTKAASVLLASSLGDALKTAESSGDTEVFIMGGAELYREAIPRAERLYLTRVHAEVDGDTHFPNIDISGWRQLESTHHPAGERNDFPCSFEVYERK
jgi:dihydrofolate reductase